MKKKISITIEAELHELAKIKAIQDKKTVSELYEEMLADYLNVNKNQTTLNEYDEVKVE